MIEPKVRITMIFGTGSVIILFLKYLMTDVQLGYLRGYDLVDLAILFPFLVIVFFQMYNLAKSDTSINNEKLNWYTFISFIIFVFGYAIHYLANTLYYAFYEYVRVNENNQKLRDLIFFYDEILGHAILFTGLIGSYWALTFHEIYNKDAIKYNIWFNQLLSVFLGFGYGMVIGIYFIEARYFIEIMILISLISIIGFIILGKLNKFLPDHHLFSLMLLASYFGTITIALIYYLIFGSFIEPSKL